MKRSIARIRLLLALLAIAAGSTALLQGMQSLTATAADDLVAATISTAPPREAAIRIETAIGDSSNRDAATAFLESRLDGHPLTLHPTLSAGAVDSDAGPLLVQSDPELESHATLVEGAWAETGQSGVLQSRAAAASGLGVGDVVMLEGALEVRIVGLWEPVDATAPHWFGEPGAASGNDDGDIGPLMVSADTLAALPAQSTARWTIETDRLAPSSLAGVEEALASLQTAFDRSGLVEGSLTIEGELAQTVSDLRSTLDASSRLTAVPLALVAATSLVTLARIAALLWTVRRGETTLLRARGTSTRRLVSGAAVEALPIAILGAVAGLLVPGSTIATSLVAAVAVLAVLVASAVLAARGAVTTVSSRRTRTVAASVAALIVVTAAVSLWQFTLYTNRPGANPFGALAPALGVLTLAVIAVGLVPSLFRALERVSVRAPGLAPALAVRHLARDAAVHATSVLLIVLSVGGATLAAGYAGSASDLESRTIATANGGDVRVRLDTRPGVDNSAGFLAGGDYSALSGATSAQPALATEARIGDSRIEFVATSPARSSAIPAGASTIEVELESPNDGENLAISAWLSDPHGQAVVVSGEPLARGGGTGTIAIPSGSWSLLAVEVTVGGISGPTVVPVRVTAVTADTTVLLDGERLLPLSVATPSARAMVIDKDPGALPIVLTDVVSRRLTAPPGSTITLTLPAIGGTVDAVVLATVPAVDGAEGTLAVQADLAALDEYLLRSGQRVPQPNEIWISTTMPDVVADGAALLSRFPAAITTRSNGAGVAGSTSAVFALGAIGAALIAVVGVAAVAGALGRERGADRRVLRALGLGDRAAARIRFAEFSLAAIAAALLGGIAGGIAIALFVPTLARTSALSLDPGLLAVAGLAVAGSLLVGAMAGRRLS